MKNFHQRLHSLATQDINSIEVVRSTYEELAKLDLTYHPDDSPEDIIWSSKSVDAAATANLSTLDAKLWTFFNTHPEFDIYDECMEAHVRVFGKASPFYRDEEEGQHND